MARSIDKVDNVMLFVKIWQEQSNGRGLDGKLAFLFIEPGVEPAIVFFEIPLRFSDMGLLKEQIHQ